ncbi:MAG: Coenzyme F420 hydrogenase/dehydrogenase, beta subunit C-terminal domain [Candidatus Bathyarchaeota archaeon]|nr:Coenzyme F420 hydrogenase/dehydrogenase, beta subunit C-terminal domain [Candidatus Bathyarchaeota archaeon]
MPIEKVSFEETLGRSVLPDNCIGCATCVIVCPFQCLDYQNGKPKLVKECKVCGICAQVCPKFDLRMSELESFLFGRERTPREEFGISRRILMAQTTDESVRKVCQDGGLVTTLLMHALDCGVIDGAVVSGVSNEEPLRPVPRLALAVDDLLASAGTRYTYSPNMLALREGIQEKMSNLAFVGTPCQINAIRRIQMVPLRKYSNAVKVLIGLFCSESFTYKGFVKQDIQEDLGINPKDVEKINIKGKVLVKTRSGETRALSLKKAKRHVSNCRLCPDFSAELADISVGGLGLEGWSLAIIRTEKGNELFQMAENKGIIRSRPIEDQKRVLDLLIKISKRKRGNP